MEPDTRIIGDSAVAFRFVNDPCCAIVASMQCASLPGCRREVFLLVPGLLFGCLAVAPAAAQQAMTNMPDMEMVPAPEQLPVPVRMQGIGNSHITIKATPDAQAWFDQGLSLLHDFWEYESAKAFEQGIRVDPNCAMCWWGLAQAEGFRRSDARVYGERCLAEAVRLKNRASASDKLYIEAGQAEANAKDDDHSAATAIYRNLVKKFPRDTQARIFLAESVSNGYDDAGEPKDGEKESLSILEGVLRDIPTIRLRTTTGSMPSSRGTIPNAR